MGVEWQSLDALQRMYPQEKEVSFDWLQSDGKDFLQALNQKVKESERFIKEGSTVSEAYNRFVADVEWIQKAGAVCQQAVDKQPLLSRLWNSVKSLFGYGVKVKTFSPKQKKFQKVVRELHQVNKQKIDSFLLSGDKDLVSRLQKCTGNAVAVHQVKEGQYEVVAKEGGRIERQNFVLKNGALYDSEKGKFFPSFDALLRGAPSLQVKELHEELRRNVSEKGDFQTAKKYYSSVDTLFALRKKEGEKLSLETDKKKYLIEVTPHGTCLVSNKEYPSFSALLSALGLSKPLERAIQGGKNNVQRGKEALEKELHTLQELQAIHGRMRTFVEGVYAFEKKGNDFLEKKGDDFFLLTIQKDTIVSEKVSIWADGYQIGKRKTEGHHMEELPRLMGVKNPRPFSSIASAINQADLRVASLEGLAQSSKGTLGQLEKMRDAFSGFVVGGRRDRPDAGGYLFSSKSKEEGFRVHVIEEDASISTYSIQLGNECRSFLVCDDKEKKIGEYTTIQALKEDLCLEKDMRALEALKKKEGKAASSIRDLREFDSSVKKDPQKVKALLEEQLRDFSHFGLRGAWLLREGDTKGQFVFSFLVDEEVQEFPVGVGEGGTFVYEGESYTLDKAYTHFCTTLNAKREQFFSTAQLRDLHRDFEGHCGVTRNELQGKPAFFSGSGRLYAYTVGWLESARVLEKNRRAFTSKEEMAKEVLEVSQKLKLDKDNGVVLLSSVLQGEKSSVEEAGKGFAGDGEQYIDSFWVVLPSKSYTLHAYGKAYRTEEGYSFTKRYVITDADGVEVAKEKAAQIMALLDDESRGFIARWRNVQKKEAAPSKEDKQKEDKQKAESASSEATSKKEEAAPATAAAVKREASPPVPKKAVVTSQAVPGAEAVAKEGFEGVVQGFLREKGLQEERVEDLMKAAKGRIRTNNPHNRQKLKGRLEKALNQSGSKTVEELIKTIKGIGASNLD